MNAPRRRGRARALLALLTLLSIAGCAASLVAGGRLQEGPFQSLLAATSQRRGIAAPAEVDARVVGREALRGLLEDAVRDEWSEEELGAYEQAIVAIGLWPPERDLLDAFLSVQSAEVAGLYLPARRAVYLVADARSPWPWRMAAWFGRRDLLREFFVAHELVHLLQHQRYPQLMEPSAALRAHDDLASAVAAALEGDATRYGLEALGAPELPDPETAVGGVDADAIAGDGTVLGAAPRLLRETLLFPYQWGYALAYREGRALLDDPPASTEQVLHPGRRREPFEALDLRELAAALPAPCRPVHENSAGELGVSILLREHGVARPEGGRGWDGDRYLVARCGDDRALLWLSSWDSEAHAEAFASAYREIAASAAARAGLAQPAAALRRGRWVRVASPALRGLDEASAGVRRARLARVDELLAFYGASR